MSGKLKGVWGAFERDFPPEDAKRIIEAIKQLRGVAGVDGVEANGDDYMNRRRIRTELELKLLDVIR